MVSRLHIVRSQPSNTELKNYLDKIPLEWLETYMAQRKEREYIPIIPFSDQKITSGDRTTFLLITVLMNKGCSIAKVFTAVVDIIKARVQRRYIIAITCACGMLEPHIHTFIHHKQSTGGLLTLQKHLLKLEGVASVYLNTLSQGKEETILATIKKAKVLAGSNVFEENSSMPSSEEDVKKPQMPPLAMPMKNIVVKGPIPIPGTEENLVKLGKILPGLGERVNMNKAQALGLPVVESKSSPEIIAFVESLQAIRKSIEEQLQTAYATLSKMETDKAPEEVLNKQVEIVEDLEIKLYDTTSRLNEYT